MLRSVATASCSSPSSLGRSTATSFGVATVTIERFQVPADSQLDLRSHAGDRVSDGYFRHDATLRRSGRSGQTRSRNVRPCPATGSADRSRASARAATSHRLRPRVGKEEGTPTPPIKWPIPQVLVIPPYATRTHRSQQCWLRRSRSAVGEAPWRSPGQRRRVVGDRGSRSRGVYPLGSDCNDRYLR